MPICRASSRAAVQFALGQAVAGAGDGDGPIAQRKLGRLGDHGAIDAGREGDGATAVAADRVDQSLGVGWHDKSITEVGEAGATAGFVPILFGTGFAPAIIS